MFLLVLVTVLLVPMPARAVPSSNIEIPASVVLTSAHPVLYISAGTPSVQNDIYLNFTRSTSDPGSWGYDVCWGAIGLPSLGVAAPNTQCFYNQFAAGNVANCTAVSCMNIPNRPGWVSFRITGSVDLCSKKSECPTNARVWEDWGFNLSANDSAGSSSLRTSGLNVTLTHVGEQNQTGNYTVQAPIVKNVTVADPLSVSGGRTLFVFHNSLNDSNASTTGDFRYSIIAQYTQPNGEVRPFPKTNAFERGVYKLVTCAVGAGFFGGLLNTCDEAYTPGTPSTTIPVFYESPSGAGNAGYRYFNVSYSGSSPFYLTVSAVPVDNATGWIGTPSCLTIVDPSRTSTVHNCGLFVSSGINPNAPGIITPSFPGLNVTQFTASTGLSSDGAGYVLAGFLLMGLFVLGWVFAQGVGAGVLAVLGAMLTYALGLIQAWAIIAVFILSAAAVVISLASGGGRRK